MDRRKFLQNIGISSMAIPLTPYIPSFNMERDTFKNRNDLIIPKRLYPGDTIGIISPASAIFETLPYEIAEESMQALGLRVKWGEHVKKRHGHLAGTDEERAEELNTMFRDPEVDAVICLRGGSGAARILPLLDYAAIKNDPKIFIGYSDITALHLAIFEKTKLVTFHGPLAVSTWNQFSVNHLKELIFKALPVQYENPTDKDGLLTQTKNRIRTITPGKVKGQLLGGNLSVLTGIMGSSYFPKNWEGKILYLEDVSEQIYRVDRMMSQLYLGGVFDEISGFIFGKCTDCHPGNGYGSLTLEEVLDHYIKPLEIPAFSGAMIGHIDDNITIPHGIDTKMDAGAGTFQLLQAAVR